MNDVLLRITFSMLLGALCVIGAATPLVVEPALPLLAQIISCAFFVILGVVTQVLVWTE